MQTDVITAITAGIQ